MLITKRKCGEAIVLHRGGKELGTVRVLDIGRNVVKLGIKAADAVGIDREEVWAEIRLEEGAPSDQD